MAKQDGSTSLFVLLRTEMCAAGKCSLILLFKRSEPDRGAIHRWVTLSTAVATNDAANRPSLPSLRGPASKAAIVLYILHTADGLSPCKLYVFTRPYTLMQRSGSTPILAATSLSCRAST